MHARSVAAAAIDGQTGEIHRRKMTPDRAEILAWIVSLAGPVRVVYEAGRPATGFGLARFLLAAGVCGGGAVEATGFGRGQDQDRPVNRTTRSGLPGRRAFADWSGYVSCS